MSDLLHLTLFCFDVVFFHLMDKSCCSQKDVFNLSPCQTFLPLLAGIQSLESRISLKSVIWHLFGSQMLNPESKAFQDYITWEEI